ncbi:MAG: hypothetical protein LBS34_00040, partial [Rickettsiales bacterium]|nr:hypothetical protein [Rickettsiales bacterium]
SKNEKYNIAIECNDFGKFLSEMNVTDKFLSGVLYFDGIIYQNNYFGGKIKIKDTFNIITENFRDTKFFKHILDSELVSKKFKRDLKSTNTVGFKKASASIYLSNNILTVDSLTLESSDIFGIGISGKGKYFLNGKKLDFNGLITPVDKINTLFRANKIPLVGKLLFANKNSGLFTIGYTLKSNADGEYVFELIPISVVNPNTLKNLLLIFVLF